MPRPYYILPDPDPLYMEQWNNDELDAEKSKALFGRHYFEILQKRDRERIVQIKLQEAKKKRLKRKVFLKRSQLDLFHD